MLETGIKNTPKINSLQGAYKETNYIPLTLLLTPILLSFSMYMIDKGYRRKISTLEHRSTEMISIKNPQDDPKREIGCETRNISSEGQRNV